MKASQKPALTLLIWLLSIRVFAQVVNFTTSPLPIVVIDTEGRTIINEPKVKAKMGIINNTGGAVNDIGDAFNDYDGFIGVEYRGSSSQALFPKKSLGIETWDADGNDINVSLLGYPEEEDWVLHGPYSDKTMMRNKLTFDLYAFTGRYGSRTRYVELVLNGQYQGVYMLMEKVKRDEGRVNIANLKAEDNSGDELTGGYILKLDKFDGSGGDGFASEYRPIGFQNDDQQIFFQYDTPSQDEITPAQAGYIQTFMRNFERTLASSTYQDPVSGYYKYVDLGSFVDFFLINEINRNVDGYRLSTFMYKDKDSNDGKLHLGPIWDFNLAFGNADYCDGGNTGGWAYQFNNVCPGDYWLIPFWWEKLLTDPVFRRQAKLRWFTLRVDVWSDEAIMEMIDGYAAQLDGPRQRNFQQWPVIGTYVWPNNFVGDTYEEEVGYLKNWITARLAWLDTELGSFEGPVDVTGVAEKQVETIAYPNPFEGTAYFKVTGHLKIKNITIYTVTGQFVSEINSPRPETGTLFWDGKTASGADSPPGTYIYLLEREDGFFTTGKLIKGLGR